MAGVSDAHHILSKVSLEDNRSGGESHHLGSTGVDLKFAVPIGVPVQASPLPTVPAREVLQASTPLLGFYFGAQWCPPCRAFSPVLSKFAQYNSKEFSVVFCSADRNIAQYREFLGKKHFLSVPFASSARTQLLELFNISSYPTLIVVDARSPELKVVTRWGRVALQGEATPGSLVQQWLSGSSGLLSNKTYKLLLLPVVCILLLLLIFWRGI